MECTSKWETHLGTTHNWSLQPTLHSIVSWQHFRAPELLKVYTVIKKKMQFFSSSQACLKAILPASQSKFVKERNSWCKAAGESSAIIFSVIPPSSLITTGKAQMIKLNMFCILEKLFLSLAWNWSRIDLGWDVKVGYEWLQTISESHPSNAFSAVSSPISFSHIVKPEATVSVCMCAVGRERREPCYMRVRQKKKALNPNTIIKPRPLSSTFPTHTTLLLLSLPISLSCFSTFPSFFLFFLNWPCFLSLLPSLPGYEKSANKKLH